MTLTVTTVLNLPLGGGARMIIYRAVDSDGSGGTVLAGVNHIDWAKISDLTTAVDVLTSWTEDSETITIGSQATSADVLMLLVIGRGG